MFSLDRQQAKVTGVNIRSELHGERNVPAVDVSLSFDAANDILSHFSSALRGALFAKAGKTAGPPQGELDGVQPVTDMPHLRDLGLDVSNLKLVYEGAGYSATLHIGASGRSDIVLGDCKLSRLRFQPREGGACSFSCMIQHSHVDEAVLGRLGSMIGATVDLTLAPPKADQAPLPADEKPAAKAKGAKPGDEAWPFPPKKESAS